MTDAKQTDGPHNQNSVLDALSLAEDRDQKDASSLIHSLNGDEILRILNDAAKFGFIDEGLLNFFLPREGQSKGNQPKLSEAFCVISKLKEGDSIHIKTYGDAIVDHIIFSGTAGVHVEKKEDQYIMRFEGQFAGGGSIGTDAGLGLAKASIKLSAMTGLGGQVELKLKSLSEVNRVVEILKKTPMTGALQATSYGLYPVIKDISFIKPHVINGEDLDFMKQNIFAVELDLPSVAELTSKLGLGLPINKMKQDLGAGLLGQGDLQFDEGMRIEFNPSGERELVHRARIHGKILGQSQIFFGNQFKVGKTFRAEDHEASVDLEHHYKLPEDFNMSEFRDSPVRTLTHVLDQVNKSHYLTLKIETNQKDTHTHTGEIKSISINTDDVQDLYESGFVGHVFKQDYTQALQSLKIMGIPYVRDSFTYKTCGDGLKFEDNAIGATKFGMELEVVDKGDDSQLCS